MYLKFAAKFDCKVPGIQQAVMECLIEKKNMEDGNRGSNSMLGLIIGITCGILALLVCGLFLLIFIVIYCIQRKCKLKDTACPCIIIMVIMYSIQLLKRRIVRTLDPKVLYM